MKDPSFIKHDNIQHFGFHFKVHAKEKRAHNLLDIEKVQKEERLKGDKIISTVTILGI